MIRVFIQLTVKEDGDIDKVRELLSTQGRLSRAEPGCERFEVCHSDDDPRVFTLNEWWASPEALDVHRTAEAYTTVYKPQVLPLVDRVPNPYSIVE